MNYPETLNAPPYYNQCFNLGPRGDVHGDWVGTRDGMSPQLEVVTGPPLIAIRQAHEACIQNPRPCDDNTVWIELAYRTDDMKWEDPSESLGRVKVTVDAVFDDEDGYGLHFLATPVDCSQLTFGMDVLWFWYYEGETGCADFRV